jgi:non-homologous end joining protein Ku
VQAHREYERGQFVTFTADELKALDVESTRTIDLATFVPAPRSIRSISTHLIMCTRTASWPPRPSA